MTQPSQQQQHKFSKCKRGCGQLVTWNKDDFKETGKWRPFNADGPDKGELHNCPLYDPSSGSASASASQQQ